MRGRQRRGLPALLGRHVRQMLDVGPRRRKSVFDRLLASGGERLETGPATAGSAA